MEWNTIGVFVLAVLLGIVWMVAESRKRRLAAVVLESALAQRGYNAAAASSEIGALRWEAKCRKVETQLAVVRGDKGTPPKWTNVPSVIASNTRLTEELRHLHVENQDLKAAIDAAGLGETVAVRPTAVDRYQDSAYLFGEPSDGEGLETATALAMHARTIERVERNSRRRWIVEKRFVRPGGDSGMVESDASEGDWTPCVEIDLADEKDVLPIDRRTGRPMADLGASFEGPLPKPSTFKDDDGFGRPFVDDMHADPRDDRDQT